MVNSPGPVEAAATESLCALDGRQQHLPLPHYDGWHDGHPTRPVPLLL